ncbi:MAG: signal recognition particle-docking protein FtsY [Actinomycetota bacterium]|nr:MAG: signal recognition particle-docking protein FtsY [Actinomycetota bacterium]
MITVTIVLAVAIVLIASTIYFVSRNSRSKLSPPSNSSIVTQLPPKSPETGIAPGKAESFPENLVPPADIKRGLGRARLAFSRLFGSILGSNGSSQQVWEELEDALLLSDLGMELTNRVLEGAKASLESTGETDGLGMAEAVKAQLRSLFVEESRDLVYSEESPTVWLVVGVNGVGKTTSIGKLAAMAASDDRKVVLAAGDTFRAAAADQLQMWAERTGADIVRSIPGADPSSVVFDSIQRAAARGFDLVIADTAGRLHTKSNLMDELRKLRRTAEREPGHLTEVLLVLDATTGQNGLVQAREFAKAVGITGVVLTKLDGSAKGGIALAAEAELGVPIKLVGVGEKVRDLIVFSPDEFLDALLDVDSQDDLSNED